MREAEESLDELEELVKTAGAVVAARVIQVREAPHPGTYIGKGKIDEVKALLYGTDAIGIVCDDELSPAQMGNLSDALDTKVMDRTLIILDIFAKRAFTREGKIQVELAQLKYRASKLTGQGKALSRLGGGIGTRGPGEKKLEMDRRLIRTRISRLKAELRDVVKHREVQRKQRQKNHLPVVCIVGYTNAGKSTLLNHFTNAGVYEEDQLFATLDPTTKSLDLSGGQTILMTDTVGFIRKLPTELVESFKSTLDEVREADLLVHIVDISHPTFEEQIEVVNRTLAEIDKTEKPMIMVFNKVDAFTFVPKEEDDLTPRGRENIDLDELKRTWMGKLQDNCIFISAKERTNIEALKEMLYERVKQIHITRFPYNDFLFQQYDEE